MALAMLSSDKIGSTTLTCILTVTCYDGDIHLFASTSADDQVSKIINNYRSLYTSKSMESLVIDLQDLCVEPIPDTHESNDSEKVYMSAVMMSEPAEPLQQVQVTSKDREIGEHEELSKEDDEMNKHEEQREESEEMSMHEEMSQQNGEITDLNVEQKDPSDVVDMERPKSKDVTCTKSRQKVRPSKYDDFIIDDKQVFDHQPSKADFTHDPNRNISSTADVISRNVIKLQRECPNCGEVFRGYATHKRHVDACRVVKCKYCVEIFDSRLSLRVHVSTDHVIGGGTCKYCGLLVNSIQQLDDHFRVCESILNKYRCIVCREKFPSNNELKQHEETHLVSKFTCNLCNMNLKTKGTLKRHFRKHAQEPLTDVLTENDRRVTSKIELEIVEDLNTLFDDSNKTEVDEPNSEHTVSQILIADALIDLHGDNREGDLSGNACFTCELCDEMFSSVKELRIHVTSHSRKHKFPCTLCRKSFPLSDELSRHMLEHSGDKPHRCRLCHKRFAKESSLRTHMVTHESVKPFLCKYCERTFPTLIQLECHIARHTGLKPYKCDKCDKSFGHKSALHVHKVAHDDNMRFQCMTCGKMFARSTQLARHNKVHTGERNVPCAVCQRWFPSRDNLRKHMSTHDAARSRPFACSICNKAFYTKNHLEQHKRTVACKSGALL